MTGGQVRRFDSDSRTPDALTEPFSGFTIRSLLPSWERSLRARNLAERTIGNYLKAATAYADWLTDKDMPADPTRHTREYVELYLVELQDRGLASGSVASHFRWLQQLYRWLRDEGEITVDPMANMSLPKITEKPPPIMPDDDIAALFAQCAGPGFEARRDTAICRLFFDTGMRLGQMASIEVEHINWPAQTIRTHAKGDKYIDVPFGAKTAQALDRYLRVRARHKLAGLPWLWLGLKGRLSDSGIYQMTVRRAGKAKIAHVHPHLWRHKFGHEWSLAGGNESDLMRLMGWSTTDMARRYGASAADARARAAHQRYKLGDRI